MPASADAIVDKSVIRVSVITIMASRCFQCLGVCIDRHLDMKELAISSDSATPLLRELNWLSIVCRVHFKLLVFTYKAMHNDAAMYLCELVCPYLWKPRPMEAPSYGSPVLWKPRPMEAPSYGSTGPSYRRNSLATQLFVRHDAIICVVTNFYF